MQATESFMGSQVQIIICQQVSANERIFEQACPINCYNRHALPGSGRHVPRGISAMQHIKLVVQPHHRLQPSRDGSVRVRRACPHEDLDSITHVVENSQEGEFRIRSAAGVAAELEGRPGRSVSGWLACIGDAPVGLAAVIAAGTGPCVRHSIAWLLVCREARRRGIGSALVAAIVRDAHDRRVSEVWVETRADWVAAVSFWRAVGFRPARPDAGG